MRTFVFGDIHGNYNLFYAILEDISPTQNDKFIFIGDIIDRGPESNQLIKLLIYFKSVYNCEFILGNHEQMMLGALQSKSDFNFWLKFGGKNTLDSYGLEYNYPFKIPYEHLEFIKDFVDFIELDSHIITHASFNPNLDPKDFSDSTLRWDRPNLLDKHKSGKLFILGHTRVEVPTRFEGCVLIDTCSGKGQSVSAICLEDNLFITSKQDEITKGFIDLK